MTKDPYKYFRMEARELLDGLNQGVLSVEKTGHRKETIARILRLAHTFKGAARVVKQPVIADFAHAIEDIFSGYREGQGTIPQDRIDQALGLLDKIAGALAGLEPAAAEQPGRTTPAIPEEVFDTVRVEIREMNTLLDSVSESFVRLVSLDRQISAVGQARRLAEHMNSELALRDTHEAAPRNRAAMKKAAAISEELGQRLEQIESNLTVGIEQVKTEFEQVRSASNRLRLLPASVIFSPLERATRDATQSLQKKVEFVSSGGENRLDAHVLAALRDALLHVVRNAVAHGIESPREREAAGKPASGRIELRVERRGTRIAFICQDDGQGIDVAAIRLTAIRRGLIAPSQADKLGHDDAIKLIMQGGVTTQSTVDAVSGRGIGMDVVRETVAKLKGEVAIKSLPGKGVTVDICVPISLSSVPVLSLDMSGTIASLPLEAVRHTLRIHDSEIIHSARRGSILFHGKIIPFQPLAAMLHLRTPVHSGKRVWSVVIIETAGTYAAIGVDRIAGTNTVVVKPLPSLAVIEPFIVGASFDEEGNPQPILDPKALIDAAQSGSTLAAEAIPEKLAPILVIDDSLTTRMLEQSILESAGYEVELATSAEDGLQKARQKSYGLFLVDVEMPGMNGFEFVSSTQNDPALRAVPSILVTSRSAEEDILRGKQAGARSYIVKGEFDQAHLLQQIRKFMG